MRFLVCLTSSRIGRLHGGDPNGALNKRFHTAMSERLLKLAWFERLDFRTLLDKLVVLPDSDKKPSNKELNPCKALPDQHSAPVSGERCVHDSFLILRCERARFVLGCLRELDRVCSPRDNWSGDMKWLGSGQQEAAPSFWTELCAGIR